MLSCYDNSILKMKDKIKILKLKNLHAKGDYTAHYKAEKIRAKYGYSGGSWGNEFIRLPIKCIECCRS